jgi:hypothetical protein
MSKFKVGKSDIINFYELDEVKKISKPSIDNLMPTAGIKLNSINLVVGGTGTGKTNSICNFIRKSSAGPGTFSDIWLVCKTDEILYTYLKKKIEGSLKVYKQISDLPLCETVENQFEKEPKDRRETLLIIDDFIAEMGDKKNVAKLEQYAIFGRKKGITQLYLTQSYFKVPKLIRLQIHYLWLLNVPNKKDLDLILPTYSLPVSNDDLKAMIKTSTFDELSFLVIGLSHNIDINKKFSNGLKNYFTVDEIVDNDNEI